MKRKDPLKILTNQTKANVSFLMMNSPNGTISSNVALNRRKLRKLLFTHYYIILLLAIALYFYSEKNKNAIAHAAKNGGNQSTIDATGRVCGYS